MTDSLAFRRMASSATSCVDGLGHRGGHRGGLMLKCATRCLLVFHEKVKGLIAITVRSHELLDPIGALLSSVAIWAFLNAAEVLPAVAGLTIWAGALSIYHDELECFVTVAVLTHQFFDPD